MRIFIFIFAFLLPLAANSLPSEKRKNGPLIQDALSPVQVSLQESSAVFYNNETSKAFLYGTVVSDDGLIMTKAVKSRRWKATTCGLVPRSSGILSL